MSDPFSQPAEPGQITYWLRPATPEEEAKHARLRDTMWAMSKAQRAYEVANVKRS